MEWSAVLRRPAHLLIPGRRPLTTALGEVIALLQLLLPEIAAHHRAAVFIHPIREVLAGHANACSFPSLQV